MSLTFAVRGDCRIARLKFAFFRTLVIPFRVHELDHSLNSLVVEVNIYAVDSRLLNTSQCQSHLSCFGRFYLEATITSCCKHG